MFVIVGVIIQKNHKKRKEQWFMYKFVDRAGSHSGL